MSRQQHSGSLQIVESNLHAIQITQNSFQVDNIDQKQILQISQHNDTFELSLDENSFVFNIEDREQDIISKKILKQGSLNQENQILKNVLVDKEMEKKVIPVVNQQRKRKRKEIFQKYKQKSTQNVTQTPIPQEKTSQLMNTFDQVFRIKSPQKNNSESNHLILQSYKKRQQMQANEILSPKINAFRKKQTKQQGQIRVTSFQQTSKVQVIQQPVNRIQFYNQENNNSPPLIGNNRQPSPQRVGSLQQFLIPSNISKIRTIDVQSNVVVDPTNSFLIETEEGNKISLIAEPQNCLTNSPEASRDSFQLESILKSEIFKEQNFNISRLNSPKKLQMIQRNGNKTIAIDDMTYKHIEISTSQNPSVFMKSTLKKFDQKQVKDLKETQIQNRFTQINGINLLKRQKSQGFLFQNNVQQVENRTLKKNFSERNLQIKLLGSPLKVKQPKKLKLAPTNTPQNRIPTYLRQVRRLNTIYPNFYFLPKNRQDQLQFSKKQNIEFKNLLQQFKKCLQFLNQVNQTVFKRHKKIKQSQMILLNSMRIETFLSCGWQKLQDQFNKGSNTSNGISQSPLKTTFKSQIDNLKPHQNFIRRKYQYQKVKGALSNYIYISQYYQRNDLDLTEQKGQKKYLDIRKKFWQIQKNIKMIGEDIYTLAIEQTFPNHYYEFLGLLRREALNKNKNMFVRSVNIKQLQNYRQLLAQYYRLRSDGDLLCNSEIGQSVKFLLEKTIQQSFGH